MLQTYGIIINYDIEEEGLQAVRGHTQTGFALNCDAVPSRTVCRAAICMLGAFGAIHILADNFIEELKYEMSKSC